MRKKKVIIWGASGHALVVADIIRINGQYEIEGFLDDINVKCYHEKFCGATILGGREQLKKRRKAGIKYLIFGFGDCRARLKLAALARESGFSFINAIHPKAVLAKDITLGEGIVVAAGAVINSAAKIGNNVIVNTCASIDHECIIGEGAHICPGVHLGGNVTIGQGAWVGIGSSVIQKVNIGAFSLIGAGSVVIKDIPSNKVAYGVPAKMRREAT